MKRIRCGIIGLGMMGKEFASSVMRWAHLPEMEVYPEVVAICSGSLKEADRKWYSRALPTITQMTTDYRALISNPEVEMVYAAVPHHLHEEIYTACFKAGKHLMGEKPFGIDLNANRSIMDGYKQHDHLLVRCATQIIFIPAVQRLGAMIEAGFFGTVFDVDAGFLHSSDLNPDKPINWKRTIASNGAYGCMGDLGMHVLHLPLRSGWRPLNVRAVLSNIMTERPDAQGNRVPCETWDNAVLLCEAEDRKGTRFPMSLRMQRISPGEKNSWYITVKGTKGAAHFTTKQINTLNYLDYRNNPDQAWSVLDMGHETSFKSVTGGIFEVGASDIILQMWGSYFYELHHHKPQSTYTQCATPEEAVLSHHLFTAALESHETRQTIPITFDRA